MFLLKKNALLTFSFLVRDSFALSLLMGISVLYIRTPFNLELYVSQLISILGIATLIIQTEV